jgi:hypothetical protein
VSRHDFVLDLLRDANPAPPDLVSTDEDLGDLLLLVRRRTAPSYRPPTTPWRRGVLVAAAVAVAVLVVGIGLILATRGPTEPEPATPTTTTTLAPTTTTVPDAVPPVTVPDTTGVAWPSPRYIVTAGFDEESDLLVLFGGTKSEDFGLNDTWVYDPETRTWEQRDPAVKPPVRFGAAMTYDPSIDRMVMFGGIADLRYVYEDLWLYDANDDTWEQVAPEGPRPPMRTYASMVYVDSLGGILLFGGTQDWALGQGTMLADTWFLDTATMTWTEIAGAGPTARDAFGLAYDPEADLVVLAGGFYPRDDITWVFDPTTMRWSSRGPTPDPRPTQLVYDPVGKRILGAGMVYSVAADTWSQLPWDETVRPNGYLMAGPFIDTNRNVLYMLGTLDPTAPGWVLGLWEYDLATETMRLIGPEEPGSVAQPETAAWPSPRYGLTVAFDEQSGLLVLFGGAKSDSVALSDTWIFDPETGAWTEQDPPVHPGPRMTAMMAYDRGLDRVVLFGGNADMSHNWDDLWLYDVDTDTWEQVDVAGPKPGPRQAGSMTYVDSLRGMLMFSGTDNAMIGAFPLRETWFLDTTTMTWTEITGDGPLARDLAGLAYDPVADLVVMAGGFRSPDNLTWTFDPATLSWSQGVATPTENPPNLLAYDRARDRMVTDGFSYSTTTGTWTPISWDTPQRADGWVATGPIVDPQGDTMYVLGPEDPFLGGWAMEMWACDLATGEWRFVGPELD